MRETPASKEACQTTQVVEDARTTRRVVRLVAIVSSLIGAVLALAVPLLPVEQDAASLSWPSGGELTGIDAPLVSYAPLTFEVKIPGDAIAALSDPGGVVVSSAPSDGEGAQQYGFFARVVADEQGALFEIVQRNRVLYSAPAAEAAQVAISVSSTAERTTVNTSVGGPETVISGDLRPQMVGVFTDLDGPAPEGLSVHADIDSRFSSTPSALKFGAMVLAALSVFISLVALHRIDKLDGRSARRFLPSNWWRFGIADAVVIGTLVLWHFIGATTSDDGYQFTMARSSVESGYMSNYFRWFGVPEAPFGTPYYDLFGLLASISTASPWVRLPALVLGIVGWLVISREVAPRLGVAVRNHRIALWTGGLLFLAFWLPYNNGLRPEPAIAIGALLTWCSVERAIATRRLLPAAVALLIAAFALTSGPSGIICFGALIAGARPIQQIITARAKQVGYLALLGPLVAAGLVVLVACFADQTLAAVIEMQRVHGSIPPSEPWFHEYKRYDWLLNAGADGSLTRRFGVFAMLLSIGATLVVMLRRGGRIPGTAVGPGRRLVGISIAAVALMTFTPTKWTHQFGVFAGLAGALAVLTAVAVGPVVLRSKRNRALFAAAVLFVLAVCFTGDNAWWYVSAWGVPWWDKPISIAGLGVSTILLGATVLALALAGWFFMREPFDEQPQRAGRLWSTPPLMIAAAGMVVICVLSMAQGAIAQYPAFSLAKSNFGALMGNACGLAEDVLVETDPNRSMLEPISAAQGLDFARQNTGFTPNGVAADLRVDEETSDDGIATTLIDDENDDSTRAGAGTGGGTGESGVNGSEVALPFGLDPATTPVLGSFGTPEPATLTSQWYALPDVGDLISIAAAGSIHSINSDGVETRGSEVTVEFGTRSADETIETRGVALPIDIGPAPSWRNLRVPLEQAPESTDAIRLVVEDTGTGQNDWVAVTPPRVPQTQTLNELVGSDTPTMIDWAVALQFPCQRPFNHHNGVAEIPEYRILPDRAGAIMTNLWQDHYGGGPLGWINMTTTSRTVPTYLNHDWDRDWGSLEQYDHMDANTVPAQIDTTSTTRSGWWNPPPIEVTW